jgi:hypothetical protein
MGVMGGGGQNVTILLGMQRSKIMGQYKMISILIKMISISEINLPVDIDQ